MILSTSEAGVWHPSRLREVCLPGFREDIIALLEPPTIKSAELASDNTARLALQEESKTLPFGAVWDFYCEMKDVPVGDAWLAEVKMHVKNVLNERK